MAYKNLINNRNSGTDVYTQTKPNQVKSSDGAWVFPVSPEVSYERFLVLGTENNTYYANSKKLTDNAFTIFDKMIAEDGGYAFVDKAREFSVSGRIPHNRTALLALAYALARADSGGKNAVIAALPQVARTASDLFLFVEYATQFRGWGRKMREAVSEWYMAKDVEEAAYQAVKYQSRKRDIAQGAGNKGYSHAALLKLAHISPATPSHNALFRWIRGYDVDFDYLPEACRIYDEIKRATSPAVVAKIIHGYNQSHTRGKITHEFIPTRFQNAPIVWEALLKDMPINAMLQNLGRLTAYGVLNSWDNQNFVENAITDSQRLRYGRVHPVVVLKHLQDYKLGRHTRGILKWSPIAKIAGAIETAFYESFNYVQPIGKNILIGLDVSGSMGLNITGSLNLTAREASVVMAMSYLRKESNIILTSFSSPNYRSYGYGRRIDNYSDVDYGIEYVSNITKHTSLNEAVSIVQNMRFGATQLSLPMMLATRDNLDIDVFMIFTDSELNTGGIHPHEALNRYRQKANKPRAALIVNGMIANDISIADPSDRYSLDVAGFDTAVPNIIREFVNL